MDLLADSFYITDFVLLTLQISFKNKKKNNKFLIFSNSGYSFSLPALKVQLILLITNDPPAFFCPLLDDGHGMNHLPAVD